MNRVDFSTTNGMFPFVGSIPNPNQPLILSVPYKGMILAQEVRTVRFEKDMGVFQIPNNQMCAGLKDRVFLRGSSLTRPIMARVCEINPQRGWITLSSFRTSPNPWKDRSCERVQPAHPILVTLTCRGQHCISTLDDLSLGGMGLLIYSSPEKEFVLKRTEKLRLDFTLPNDPFAYRVDGSMVFFTQMSRTLAKLGLKFESSRQQRARLARYIDHRTLELLRELEISWAKEQEPRGSMDLYF